jgi:hypothetical protein
LIRDTGTPGTSHIAQAELLPFFIAVRNGDDHHLEPVREGNEHVIRARFTDAAYFVREDVKRPLEAYLPRLGTLTFQVRLGSMLDKSQRVRGLAAALATILGFDPQETAHALRAAELCKADLATNMVVEMTSLQGVMGRTYALNSGELPQVAEAIYEHYLPRFAGDATPRTRPGLLVGLAEATRIPLPNAALPWAWCNPCWPGSWISTWGKPCASPPVCCPSRPRRIRRLPAWTLSWSDCATCFWSRAGATMWWMPPWQLRGATRLAPPAP